MKRLLAIATVILACSAPYLRAEILAGPITNAATGHYYFLLAQTNWVESEREAKTMGGHLATIDDAAEQLWVYSTFSAWGGTYRVLWIGLNDRTTEGAFRWAGGAPVSYTNWSPGEPNNGGAGGPDEDAIVVWPPNGIAPGKWNDTAELTVAYPPTPCNAVVEVDPIQMQIQVSQVAVSWNSALDINYQVQYASTVTSGTWTNLGGPVTGTGSNHVIIDSVLNQPQKVYRVLTVP